MTLTPEERTALEHAIGAGWVEFGGPPHPDDPGATACRKLGLNPIDWRGKRMLEVEAEA